MDVVQDAVVLQHGVELIGGPVELNSYDNLLLVSARPFSMLSANLSGH
jgi:hypothetical protein